MKIILIAALASSVCAAVCDNSGKSFVSFGVVWEIRVAHGALLSFSC
jgi:hypothetical protein